MVMVERGRVDLNRLLAADMGRLCRRGLLMARLMPWTPGPGPAHAPPLSTVLTPPSWEIRKEEKVILLAL